MEFGSGRFPVCVRRSLVRYNWCAPKIRSVHVVTECSCPHLGQHHFAGTSYGSVSHFHVRVA